MSSYSSPYLAINQTGLLTGYTSLSTDFDLYLASNPLHQPDFGTGWSSRKGFPNAHIDFDLGGTYVIESMALWNFGASEALNLVRFELHASNDAFATSILLGSFEANPLLTTDAGTAAEIFSFAPASASVVRMVLLSSNESPATNVGIGEVAFEVYQNPVPAVPEPASVVLLGSGLSAIAVAGRKRLRSNR